MNDFTKEELQQIRGGLDWWLDNDWTNCFALVHKIQSMIDNYEQDQKVKESLNLIIEKAREWKIEL